MAEGAIHKRYNVLEAVRKPYLERARRCSELTLPYILPPEGSDGSTELLTPYQSVGARGVSNLSAKLVMTTFPAGRPFFKYDMDKFARLKLDEEADEGIVDKALSDVESSVMSYFEASSIRTSSFELFKHLLISGNILVYKTKDSDTKKPEIQLYGLDKYVVKRTPRGRLKEIITKEAINPSSLDPKIVKAVGLKLEGDNKKNCDLYTQIVWSTTKKRWYVKQELNGVVVPGSSGNYPNDKLPWLALRLHKIDGEDYGRGLVEEYLGDLVSLEELYMAIVKGSAAAAKVVFMNNPNGTTKTTDLTEADSGDFIDGDSNDITTLQLEKFNDFQVALATIERIEKRLIIAFLLREGVQRDAERVTAEEIKFMATELDDALGGIYSIVSQTFQLPLVVWLMDDMTKADKLPELPEDVMNPVIVTGLDALGRNADLAKLDALVKDLFNLDPVIAERYVDLSEYISRRGAALQVDTEGLIRTKEEVQESMQQAQQMQMIQEGIKPAVKGMADNINQSQ